MGRRLQPKAGALKADGKPWTGSEHGTGDVARQNAARLARAAKAHTLITNAVRMLNEAHTEIEALVGSEHAAATIAMSATEAAIKARAWSENVTNAITRAL